MLLPGDSLVITVIVIDQESIVIVRGSVLRIVLVSSLFPSMSWRHSEIGSQGTYWSLVIGY